MDNKELPEHLRDNAEFQVCDNCGRRTYARSHFNGGKCELPQPDGTKCKGRFRNRHLVY